MCVQWAHPKDKGCNVQPQAAQSGCCAWHLGPLSLCRNWHGAGSFSKSQVLFYLSESTSDLSRRTPQRDLPLRLSALPLSSSLLSHTSQWTMGSRAISQACLHCQRNRLAWTFVFCLRLSGSLSFSFGVNVPPQDSPVWLRRTGSIFWQVLIFFHVTSFWRLNVAFESPQHSQLIQPVSTFELRANWKILQDAFCVKLKNSHSSFNINVLFGE